MAAIRLLCFLVVCCAAGIQVISSVADPRDAAALRSLKDQWQNTPPSWGKSGDPCAAPWEGVTCNNSRVTALGLSSMGLIGKLSGDIGGLTELRSLDLSFNQRLTGSLSSQLGDLQKLNILILAGCSFSGNIPNELGNLVELSFLALNSNNFTGQIPASLGSLSKLYWLDLADNQLTGSLPISKSTTPGLDLLKKAKHFHFNKNKLSGPIPAKLFSSDMVLIHVLFDGNQLTGKIPDTLGLVQTLEVLRLDRNTLTGNVPSNLNNLTNVVELNLAHNDLSGPLPNLSGMISLNYVDLSNNSFQRSEAPTWFSTLQSLTTLVIEYGSLQGLLPQKLFSSPQIQQVKLRNNAFNDTLNMGNSISQQLQLVDLQNNQISTVTLGSGYTNTLILIGNPVCTTALANTAYCQLQQQTTKPYSTSVANCGSKSCSPDQKLNPQSCDCAFPYEGTLYFRGPSFRELSNVNMFHSLEMSLWTKLGLTPGSVSLQNPFFNIDDYLQVQLDLFPSTQKYFNRSEILRLGFYLSNQTYKPPPDFGPYYFIASPYFFPDEHGGTSISSGTIIGIAIGCGFLVLLLVGLGAYAVRQKKRAEKAIGLSKPFASWAPSGKDSGGAPQLKGARWFSYDELKKCTNNFSDSNEIGSGGYGKVYRGMLTGGQVVAIKRAQQGSMQGGLEFKTEIELLSRVHHKNLVGLVGFCFEQGEQMLVYEFMPNGTLRESLSGRSGIHLDWKRRLRIAIGSARGLAYLHELADPPIIHRDVKSTNILLDENLTAKVADFGLSKLVSDSEKGHVSTQVKGTLEMSSGTGSLGSTSGTPMEEDDHAPLWCYVTKLEKLGGGGNTRFKCNYCQQEYRGSYFRVKAHLLKLSGNGIRVCPKVTPQYLAEMQKKIEEAEKRLKMAMPKKVPLPPSTQSTSTGSGALDIGGFKMEGYEPRKRKATGTSALEKAFNPVIREQLHSEIARMFYSAGLPFHLSRNPYYVSAFQFAANNPIPGYVPPGYNLLRTTLLQKERANVERLLEPTKASWKEKGLSIVSDGWTDSQRRPLINFMGASEAGAVFLKAVNCEGEHKDKFFISNLISQAIEEVGHQNVIQVIIDNAPVCSAAGLLIESKYPNIFWTPCVVHTLNLAVKNICAPKETGGTAFAYDECHWITLCVDDVMFIKNFIMNHSMRLAIFNEFVPLKLLAVADTRFASAIIMLKRFKLIKRGLQSMVISDQWVSYKEDDVGKAASVKEKLLNDVWWDKIDYILSFTLPIYEMLRFCDTDKPCLHLVYEMWDTMIEKVKASIFRHEGKLDHEESIFYSVVHNILVERWSKSNTPLHCLAHSLNPRYYSSTWLDENPNRVPPHRDEEISSMRNKCFKKYFPNLEERRVVNVEYAKFSGGLDMFGDFDSKIDRGVLDPLIWWFTHGSPAPMLQSLALKLLGQPCSSSCCERNWSTYSFIHSMKRNKMTPQRAEDLVFVHNNLRLLSRRSRQYIEGESKLWDVGGDAFDSLEGAGLLEIASLSLDEPDMEAVIFTEDEGEQVEPIDVEDS